MPLSKKNYEDMAIILGSPRYKSKGQIVNALANYFKEDNPRFDKSRFVSAIAKEHINVFNYPAPHNRKIRLADGRQVVI